MMPPIEPSAEYRQLAVAARQIYVAFIEAGFTEEQALVLLVSGLTGRTS